MIKFILLIYAQNQYNLREIDIFLLNNNYKKENKMNLKHFALI